jgi:proline iminopeptidase
MLYALTYPEPVDKIIFENPTFDIGGSDRSMTRMLIDELRRQKMDSEADELATALASASSPRDAWKLFGRAGRTLGTKRRLDLYAPSLPSGYFFGWMSHSGLSQEIWLRGSGPSQETLWKGAQVFEDFRPRLKELRTPAVLFKGRMDANTGPEQIESLQSSVKDGRVVTFPRSGHMIHAEEPKLFAQTVRAVLLE